MNKEREVLNSVKFSNTTAPEIIPESKLFPNKESQNSGISSKNSLETSFRERNSRLLSVEDLLHKRNDVNSIPKVRFTNFNC